MIIEHYNVLRYWINDLPLQPTCVPPANNAAWHRIAGINKHSFTDQNEQFWSQESQERREDTVVF